MKNKPWFPFYWKDWQTDPKLSLCSLQAKGLLIELMATMWPTGGKLMDLAGKHGDEFVSSLARIMRMRDSNLRKALGELLQNNRVFWDSEGTLCCARLMQVHDTQRTLSDAGKRGGNPELLKDTLKGGDNAKSKVKDKANIYKDDFDRAWSEYPDKTGKSRAKKAYIKARESGTSHGVIMDGLRRYVAYVTARRKKDFSQLSWRNGSTWFYNEGWDDEYTIVYPESKERIF